MHKSLSIDTLAGATGRPLQGYSQKNNFMVVDIDRIYNQMEKKAGDGSGGDGVLSNKETKTTY